VSRCFTIFFAMKGRTQGLPPHGGCPCKLWHEEYFWFDRFLISVDQW